MTFLEEYVNQHAKYKLTCIIPIYTSDVCGNYKLHRWWNEEYFFYDNLDAVEKFIKEKNPDTYRLEEFQEYDFLKFHWVVIKFQDFRIWNNKTHDYNDLDKNCPVL